MSESADTPVRAVPDPVAALNLIAGPEEILAERAVASILADLAHATPELEVVPLHAESYQAGDLLREASPSLFGEDKAVIVHDLDEAPDELQVDLLEFLEQGADGVTLVVCHKSGNRGKKVLDALKKGSARRFEAAAIKTDRDKSEFVTSEFQRARRKVTQPAVRALVEALGKDLRELASGISQLVEDTTGVIDEEVVDRYHGGKVEATGFRVADAAIAGEVGEALRLLRHALAVGVDPVPIVAVLAGQLRQLAKVGGAGRGRSADIAREVGMAPWQVDKARRALSGWDGPGLGQAIQAVAAADFEVKGGGRDPEYAIERAIVAIGQSRR